MNDDAIRALDGRSVLVRPAATGEHWPVAGGRGILRVSDSPDSQGLRVEIQLERPHLFTRIAHQELIRLTDNEVRALLATDRNGAFEYVLDET